jgi:UTP-glucose-1-phosphate uridylyltransferase
MPTLCHCWCFAGKYLLVHGHFTPLAKSQFEAGKHQQLTHGLVVIVHHVVVGGRLALIAMLSKIYEVGLENGLRQRKLYTAHIPSNWQA